MDVKEGFRWDESNNTQQMETGWFFIDHTIQFILIFTCSFVMWIWIYLKKENWDFMWVLKPLKVGICAIIMMNKHLRYKMQTCKLVVAYRSNCIYFYSFVLSNTSWSMSHCTFIRLSKGKRVLAESFRLFLNSQMECSECSHDHVSMQNTG